MDEGTEQDRSVAAATAFLDARALIGCRHRLNMNATHPELLTGVREDAGVQQRREAAVAHRLRVRDALVGARPEQWVVIDPALRAADRAESTMRACAAGALCIWGGLLPQEPDTGRRGGAEILLRDLDRGGYIPVIVVNHKVTDPRQPEPPNSTQPPRICTTGIRSRIRTASCVSSRAISNASPTSTACCNGTGWPAPPWSAG